MSFLFWFCFILFKYGLIYPFSLASFLQSTYWPILRISSTACLRFMSQKQEIKNQSTRSAARNCFTGKINRKDSSLRFASFGMTINTVYKFLSGLNYMGMDSMERAIQQFNSLNALPINKEGRLYASVHWYSGLC